MPDKDGKILPPIEEFDGDKQSTELKFNKCKHTFNIISPTDVRCIKCGVGYTGTPNEINQLYNLFTK